MTPKAKRQTNSYATVFNAQARQETRYSWGGWGSVRKRRAHLLAAAAPARSVAGSVL